MMVLDVFPHIGSVGVGAHEGAQTTNVMAVVHHTEVAPHPRGAPRRAARYDSHAHTYAGSRQNPVQGEAVRRQRRVGSHVVVVVVVVHGAEPPYDLLHVGGEDGREEG